MDFMLVEEENSFMLASRRIHFELLVVMGKLKKNYYAVRVGRVSGIFRSWYKSCSLLFLFTFFFNIIIFIQE